MIWDILEIFAIACVRACMCACVRACTHTDQVLCVELVLGFWPDQPETFSDQLTMS